MIPIAFQMWKITLLRKKKRIDSLNLINALFSQKKSGRQERKALTELLVHCPTFLLASQTSRDLDYVGSIIDF